MKKEIAVEIEKRKIDFLAKGIVVDEGGQPLNDVKLTITRTTHGCWGRDDDKKEILNINGKFDIKASRINTLFLEFYKNGYYIETLALTRNSPIEYKNLYTSTFENGVITANDIKVVMRAKGITAKMDRIKENLTYNETGSGSVINFDTKNVETIKDISDMKNLPENCIYVYTERTADGKIDVIKPKSKINDPNVDNDVYPKKITFKTSDPEGGFIIFHNKKGDAYQYMKEAPATGYQNEMIFNVEYGEDIPIEVYFYFKSKGQYGKGSFIRIMPQFDTSKKQVKDISVGLRLMLNPDGSRNVNGN
jgi:hypothetical protein